jgi:hypothetical protein
LHFSNRPCKGPVRFFNSPIPLGFTGSHHKESEMKKVFTLALALVLSVAAISSIGCGGSEPTKGGTSTKK